MNVRYIDWNNMSEVKIAELLLASADFVWASKAMPTLVIPIFI